MKRDKTEALDDLLESNKLSISDKENQSGFYTGYINVIDITIDQFKQNENLTGAELHHAIDAEITKPQSTELYNTSYWLGYSAANSTMCDMIDSNLSVGLEDLSSNTQHEI